jgi:hypothetical protein
MLWSWLRMTNRWTQWNSSQLMEMGGNTNKYKPNGTVTIADNDTHTKYHNWKCNSKWRSWKYSTSNFKWRKFSGHGNWYCHKLQHWTLDYANDNNSSNNPSGSLSVDVVIPITDDLIDEPNEIFTVDGTVVRKHIKYKPKWNSNYCR